MGSFEYYTTDVGLLFAVTGTILTWTLIITDFIDDSSYWIQTKENELTSEIFKQYLDNI